MRALAPLLALTFLLPACGPADVDGDGVPATLDCDDTNAAVFPGANEICDGLDNDCNEVVDDEYAKGGKVYFLDRDGDGYGVWEHAVVQCSAPAGYVANSDDCADDDDAVFPGAPEFCDRIDQNCNGLIDDEAVDAVAYYSDFDQDGYGGADQAEFRCEQPDGYIVTGGDCNDFDPYVNPEAVERCDLEDNNCNGVVDEGASLDATVWYADKDRDGYGSIEDTIEACYQPEYYVPVEESGDCDDLDDAVNPGAREVCFNGIDDNCDGSANQCDVSNWTDESVATVVVTGPSGSAYLGRDSDFIGDFNGDGFDDMVFGAYRATGSVCAGAGSSYCGGAYVVMGGDALDPEFSTPGDTLEFGTAEGYDYMGIAVAGVGDLDNDGYDDLAMGAYGHGGYGYSYQGALFLAYGHPTAWQHGEAHDGDAELPMVFGPSQSSSYLGYSIGGPGDMDGDGFDDMIVAAYRASYGAGDYGGAVLPIYGGKERLSFTGADYLPAWTADNTYDYLGGQSGNAIGGDDFDGDGFGDIVLGAYGHDGRGSSAGQAYVIYGDGTRLAGHVSVGEAADATIYGDASGSYAGGSAGTVGDVNGDGYADLFVGAYYGDGDVGGCGIAFGGSERLSGAQDITELDAWVHGNQTYEYACRTGAAGTDLDGDGVNEVVMGSDGYDESTLYSIGRVLIFKGGETLSGDLGPADAAAILTHSTTSSYTYFGYGTSTVAGDVNGDGYGDLLIGAYGVNSSAGAGYLFQGVGQ